MYKLIGLLLFGLLFSSCKDELAQIREDNDKTIKNYLEEHNLTAESTDSGLYYIITKEGNGEHPTINDDVKVKYKGYTLVGVVFDESLVRSVTFPLQSLIKGWQEGIPKMSKGGKATLFVPSHLAYGSSSPSNNEPIIFEIELIDF